MLMGDSLPWGESLEARCCSHDGVFRRLSSHHLGVGICGCRYWTMLRDGGKHLETAIRAFGVDGL